MGKYYIGLLSGTSVDGVDCAIVDFSDPIQIIATHTQIYPSELVCEIHDLSFPGHNEIERLGMADRQIGLVFAEGCLALLKKAKLSPSDIVAIGSHGQNIRHRPNIQQPFTLQIGDPNIIAAQTGILTIADFRRKDVALGGQGAPLVPLVHQALFHHPSKDRVILNIGGISNITFLAANKETLLGFDTGPGNTLLDALARKNLGQPFDSQGKWAATGKIHQPLLQRLLEDPYFSLNTPKSTGREYFNEQWLLEKDIEGLKPNDVQATLVELTAMSIAKDIKKLPAYHPDIFVCGGGTHNAYLFQRLNFHCHPLSIQSTAILGVDPNWIEAILFAWLAKQTHLQLPGNAPVVTGASRASVLGGIYYP